MYPVGGFALNLLPNGRPFKLYSIHTRKRRRPEDYRHDVGQLLQLLGNGEISPLVARRFELSEAAAAHELLARKALPGNVVLTNERRGP